MKTCSDCGELKTLAEFYVQRACADGHQPHCKACHGKRYYQKANAGRHNEEYLAKRREWAGSRRHLPNVKAREVRHAAAYRAKYPDKQLAKQATARAIKAGKLLPGPCEVCGKSGLLGKDGRRLIQAHHHDYSKPLAVTWLCVMCHSKEHRRSLKTPPSQSGEGK